MKKNKQYFLASLTIFFCLAAFLFSPPAQNEAAQSRKLEWLRNAKFGLFIHWGVYSLTGQDEWARDLFQIPLSEYQEYADNFNPVDFNPEEWVRLAKEAGVKYIIVTAKHHDGFCLFDSQYTDYDIMDSKYGKDALGMFVEACREQEMPFGFYYSLMDWHHPDYLPRRSWETSRSVKNANFDRYMDYVVNQLKELVDKYDPSILWFDGEWEHTSEEHRMTEIEELLLNMKPDLLINDRLFHKEPGRGDFATQGNNIPATGLYNPDGTARLWEAGSFLPDNGRGYNFYEMELHSPTRLIRQLIEVVSKGGNLLLDIRTTPQGTIQPEFKFRLKRIGEWLQANGEAIYGCTANVFERLPFFGRCTVKENRLYIHIMGWPENRKIRLPGLKTLLRKVYPLSRPEKNYNFRRTWRDIVISLPEQMDDMDATVVAVELQGEPQVRPYEIRPSSGGKIELPVCLADVQSEMGQQSYLDYFYKTILLTNWRNVSEFPVWKFTVTKEGTYKVHASYASMGEEQSAFVVEVDDQQIHFLTQKSPNAYLPATFFLGTVELTKGMHILSLKIKSIVNNQTLRLEKVALIRE
ncbi:MAG: alpha-L-fucosidase [Candidatus Aminicenantales bacterium]